MDTNLLPLIELARSFNQEQTLDRMLQRMVDCTAVLLWARRASVWLLDDAGAELMAVCRAGTSLHTDPSHTYRVGEGLNGWVAEHVKPLRTGDAENDKRFVKRAGMKTTMGSYLGVPLVAAGGECMGVLSSVESGRDYFTLEHQDLQTLIAAICEPHIKIARAARLGRGD